MEWLNGDVRKMLNGGPQAQEVTKHKYQFAVRVSGAGKKNGFAL